MQRIRLGIIQVNHDKTPEVGDKFPDDAHRFRDLFDALDDVRFRYQVYMTIGGVLPADIDEQDAYLITGSPLSVLDESLEWLPALFDFIRRCDAAEKPLVGTCFGHQAIAKALGGEVVEASVGWNVGIENQKIIAHEPWMDPAVSTLPLYVFHQDQVTRLPAGCRLLGTSNRCPIAAFAKGRHIFTTQAHPEFTDPFMRAVVAFCREYFSDADYEAILASLDGTQDGARFARWATDFIQGQGEQVA